MAMGIRTKVGGFLAAVLVLAFGTSTWVSTVQCSRMLGEYGREAGRALRDEAYTQARNVFTSLEMGTRGSLERGEMETFERLLRDLGKIQGVLEIGLAGPDGKIAYSSHADRVRQALDPGWFRGAATAGGRVSEVEDAGALTLLRAHRMGRDCLRCHAEAAEGDLAGVLYVRYSLAGLVRAEQASARFLARARRAGIVRGVSTGLAGLAVACLGVYLLLGARVRRPLTGLTERVREMASGEADLTRRLPEGTRDEMGDLARAFNTFVANLQALVREVLGTAEEVASGSREILAASAAVLDRAEAQKDRTHASATSAEQMSATVSAVAREAHEAAEIARQASDTAEEGGGRVDQGVLGMDRVEERVRAIAAQVRDLGRRTGEIGAVMQVIEDISDQTNLLALNAAIEAARAGVHGRGFAVVADEVRKLSEKTARATRQVRETVAAIQQEASVAVGSVEQGLAEVEHSSALVRGGGEALREIVAQIEQTSERVARIATSTEEQSAAVGEISRNLDAIAGLASDVAAGVEQARATAERLGECTERLQDLMARFRV